VYTAEVVFFVTFKVTIVKPVVGEIWQELSDVLEYWMEVRGERTMPRWHYSSFDLACIHPDSIPYVAVFDVLPSDFRIRYFGTQRVRLQGKDYTNCLLSEYKPGMIALKIEEELKMVLKNKEPMKVSTQRTDPDSSEKLTYEFLYLPLSTNGRDVDTVFTLGLDNRSLQTLHREYHEARRKNRVQSFL
jgi:hypothetical protein